MRYRHEVLRDLEEPDVCRSIANFADAMTRMREHLTQAEKLHYQSQKGSWFVNAVEAYYRAVRSLVGELADWNLASRGLEGLRDYLSAYLASGAFVSLEAETQELMKAFGAIRYTVRIQGQRVTVMQYEGDDDYGAQVQATFEKFRQGT